MPGTGYNFMTYIDHFRSSLVEVLPNFEGSREWHEGAIAPLLDEALDRIAQVTRWLKVFTNGPEIGAFAPDLGLNVVSGQFFYSFYKRTPPVYPPMLGLGIRSVRLVGSDGTLGNPLREVTYAEMLEQHSFGTVTGGITTSNTGTPLAWCRARGRMINESLIVEDGAPQEDGIIIMPAPNWSRTKGLVVEYDARGVALDRIWNPGTAVTAQVTQGSSLIYLSKTFVGKVRIGDEIGFVRKMLSGGRGAPANVVPWTWYRLIDGDEASGGPTTFELALGNEVGEETDLTMQFIVAQVPELERAQPGKLGWSPVDLAVARKLRLSHPKLAKQLEESAWGWINSLVDDEPKAMTVRGTPAAHMTNFEK